MWSVTLIFLVFLFHQPQQQKSFERSRDKKDAFQNCTLFLEVSELMQCVPK